VSGRRALLSLLAGAALLPGAARAQERFSLFVGSPQFTVDRIAPAVSTAPSIWLNN